MIKEIFPFPYRVEHENLEKEKKTLRNMFEAGNTKNKTSYCHIFF